MDDIVERICDGLTRKSEDIDALRNSIKLYSICSDKIKEDLSKINKFQEVNSEKTCLECDHNLFSESFYIFPCKHRFHKVINDQISN